MSLECCVLSDLPVRSFMAGLRPGTLRQAPIAPPRPRRESPSPQHRRSFQPFGFRDTLPGGHPSGVTRGGARWGKWPIYEGASPSASGSTPVPPAGVPVGISSFDSTAQCRGPGFPGPTSSPPGSSPFAVVAERQGRPNPSDRPRALNTRGATTPESRPRAAFGESVPWIGRVGMICLPTSCGDSSSRSLMR